MQMNCKPQVEVFAASAAFRKLLLLLTVLLVWSCDQNTPAEVDPESERNLTDDEPVVESTELQKEEIEEIEKLVTYHLDTIRNKEELDSFKTRFDPEIQDRILALNRMDAWKLRVGDTLVIPDSVKTDFLSLSPFPKQLDVLNSINKVILVSRRVQAIGLYEGGKLVTWGPASTGKESSQTPTGLFYGNYRSKKKTSTVDSSWILPYYFNFMNYEGIGTHEYTLPGYPASHGCVRLRNRDAQYIYEWAKQWELNENEQVVLQNGTPFMVIGDYDFDKTLPWLKLAEDPESNFLTEEEMDTLKTYVTRYQNDPKNFKDSKGIDGEISFPDKNLESL